MIVQFAFIFWLIIISIQDFKYRAISWYLFPVGLGILILHIVHLETGTGHIRNVLFNTGFVILQLSIVTAYFSIKHKRFVNIFNRYFGVGDLLFLWVITLAFSPVNYMVFVIFSLFMSLTGFLIFTLFKEVEKIPLAGAMAVLLAGVTGLAYFIPLDLHSDQWIINLLL